MLSLSMDSFYAKTVSRNAAAVDLNFERMSSGRRINRAGDDPAGMSIAESLRTQVEGSQQASRNVQDAINVIRIAQDAIGGFMPILDRMKELIVQASNSTYTDAQREPMQREVDELKALFTQAYFAAKDFRVALDGVNNADRILNFQVGSNSGQYLSVDYNPLRGVMGQFIVDAFGYQELYDSPFQEFLAGYYGSPIPQPTDLVPPVPPFTPGQTFAQALPKKIVLTPRTDADIATAFSVVDNAKVALLGQATYFGAISNRLESTLENLGSFTENAAQSMSTIRDVDFAAQSVEMTKSQVLQQASTAILAQSNQRPFQVLELLRS